MARQRKVMELPLQVSGERLVFEPPEEQSERIPCRCRIYRIRQSVLDDLGSLFVQDPHRHLSVRFMEHAWKIGYRWGGHPFWTLDYDPASRWEGTWIVGLRNREIGEVQLVADEAVKYSVPVRNALLDYERRVEEKTLFVAWNYERAARKMGMTIREFKALPKYAQRIPLLEAHSERILEMQRNAA